MCVCLHCDFKHEQYFKQLLDSSKQLTSVCIISEVNELMIHFILFYFFFLQCQKLAKNDNI